MAFEREHAERLCEDDIADDTSSVTSSTAELTAPAAAEPQPSSPASTNPPSPPIADPPQSPCMLSLPSSHFLTYHQAESVDVDLLTEEIEASIEGVEKRVVSDIKLCFSYIIDMLHHVPSVREYCIQKGFTIRSLYKKGRKHASAQVDPSDLDMELPESYRPPTPPTELDADPVAATNAPDSVPAATLPTDTPALNTQSFTQVSTATKGLDSVPAATLFTDAPASNAPPFTQVAPARNAPDTVPDATLATDAPASNIPSFTQVSTATNTPDTVPAATLPTDVPATNTPPSTQMPQTLYPPLPCPGTRPPQLP